MTALGFKKGLPTRWRPVPRFRRLPFKSEAAREGDTLKLAETLHSHSLRQAAAGALKSGIFSIRQCGFADSLRESANGCKDSRTIIR